MGTMAVTGLCMKTSGSEQLLTGKEQRESLIYIATAEHPGLAHLGSSLLLPTWGGQRERPVGNFIWSSDCKISYRQEWQNLQLNKGTVIWNANVLWILPRTVSSFSPPKRMWQSLSVTNIPTRHPKLQNDTDKRGEHLFMCSLLLSQTHIFLRTWTIIILLSLMSSSSNFTPLSVPDKAYWPITL